MSANGGTADIAEGEALALSAEMDWSAIATDFHYDGSLRDIYILDTSLDDWAIVWALLIAASHRLSFEVDGVAMMPPADVRDAFRLRGSHSVTASYRLGKQRLNCHFFLEEEVEFDLDPRDVDGPVEAERLAEFLALLGRATAKEVRLTAENAQEAVIARYDPTAGSIVWLPITP